jgi:dihydrofolate reductase
MNCSIVVAVSENGVIGSQNRLPWKLSDDLRYFKNLTLGKYVIMGRKTFDSIGKPLKERTNLIITRNQGFYADGVLIFHSIETALEYAGSRNQQEVFIIGGAELYKRSLPLSDRIYYTKVDCRIEGDAFFPELNPGDWMESNVAFYDRNEKNEYSFRIIILDRKKYH